MNRRTIVLVLVAVALLVGYYFYGNPISVFFLAVMLMSVNYFLTTLKSEKYVVQKFDNNADRQRVFNRHRVLNSALLLGVIFVLGVVVTRYYMNPWDDTPYFNNTDHTAVMNSGLVFDHEVTIFTDTKDIKQPGLYKGPSGTLKLQANRTDKSLLSSDFTVPVFLKFDDQWLVQNNFYKTPLQPGISIQNDRYKLEVLSIENIKNLWGASRPRYNITLRFADKKIGSSDTIKVVKYMISRGISLFDLLLKSKSKQVEYSSLRTKGRMDKFLLQTKRSLFLANKNENHYLTFFPSAEFFDNGYQIALQGAIIKPQLESKIPLVDESRFFVGLSNSRHKMYVNQDPSLKRPELNFDFQRYYPLQPSVSNTQVGFSQIRFLANHYKQILDQNMKEGFLLQPRLRNAPSNQVSAVMRYTIGSPGQPLNFTVMDHKTGKYSEHLPDGKLALTSASGSHKWIVEVKDFSRHGFTFFRVFIYLSILFLAFLAITFYAPSMSLTRIEPIIYAILFALIVFRMILLWRVATFPPLDDISHHELNTLRFYDYDLLGIKLPLPQTLLLPLLFAVFVYLYRKSRFTITIALTDTLSRVGNFVRSHLPVGVFGAFLDRRIFDHPVFKDCLVYFGLGLLAYLGIKVLGVEFLLRVMAILYPVIVYFILSKKHYFSQAPTYTKKYRLRLVQYVQEFVYYLQSNPVFYVAIATIIYLLITDRGFSIVFLLFLFIKSIFFNFLSTPFNGKWGQMLFAPRKYWIYGILSLVIVLFFLAWKGAFLFLLDYKVVLAGAILLIVAIYLGLLDFKQYRKTIIVTGAISLVLLVPITGNYINQQIDQKLKHVIYRAAIISEPIEDLIYASKTSSFEEKKIYETAENQWFINSYLGKIYTNKLAINLRPHFNSGVNYSTQTRDVVLPRYVISEHGSFVMLVILLILALPFVFFQISYGLLDDDKKTNLIDNALSGKAFLLFFSIGFFVWLTSTNRFVFFGQDFPFLSLTSKMSLLMSLVIFLAFLFSKPQEKYIRNVDVGLDATRQIVLGAAIALVLIFAGRSNLLNSTNFVIDLAEPEYAINNKLNNLLIETQLKNDFSSKDKAQILDSLWASPDFEELYDRSTTYTKSVIDVLRSSPAIAETTTSPIFLRNDNGVYKVEYNRNLHLELPAYDNRTAWKGDILQGSSMNDQYDYPNLVYGDIATSIEKPFATYRTDRSGVVIVPNTWLPKGNGSLALVDIHNANANNRKTTIQTYNPKKDYFQIQDVDGYVTPMHYHDISIITTEKGHITVSLNPNTKLTFMSNYWVNGKQRMMYPMSEDFFYIYHLSHTLRDLHKENQKLDEDIQITLSYNVQQKVQEYIDTRMKELNDPKIKFAAIAANNNGDILFMNDYNPDKIQLDPNDEAAIADLKSDQFFYSSNRTERDQWANLNLIHMAYGPGSSIKPALASAVASQVNAEWEKLVLIPALDVFERSKKDPSRVATYQYAGYRIPNTLGWEDEPKHLEHAETIDIRDFIVRSSNFYHSVLMFLGSYRKEKFYDGSTYSLRHLLQTNNNQGKNRFPRMQYDGVVSYLPNYNEDQWPSQANKEKKHFDDPQAILPNGINFNYGVIVDDENKNDYTLRTLSKVNFTDQKYFDTVRNQSTAAAVWTFPEPSYFIQEDRAYKDPIANFMMGVKNPSLGGAPWYITPLKMAEMYGSLFSQNNAYSLHVTPQKVKSQAWNIDDSWAIADYYNFLTNYIFSSMQDVLIKGTARGLGATLGLNGNQRDGFYFYAKTGTIGSGKQNSKRFVLIISDKDLTDVGNIGHSRFYVVYFTANEMANQDWQLYKNIIDEMMNSQSFKSYMQ